MGNFVKCFQKIEDRGVNCVVRMDSTRYIMDGTYELCFCFQVLRELYKENEFKHLSPNKKIIENVKKKNTKTKQTKGNGRRLEKGILYDNEHFIRSFHSI